MTWYIDPHHSSVTFGVKHMMVATVRGSFTGLRGTIEYDPRSPDRTRIEAIVGAHTVNTGEEKRDGHLRRRQGQARDRRVRARRIDGEAVGTRRLSEPRERVRQWQVGQGLHQEVGLAEIALPGELIRYGDAGEAGRFRGADAVRRVLDGDRLARGDAEPFDRAQEEIRLRLGARDVLAAHNRIPVLHERETLEVTADPAPR